MRLNFLQISVFQMTSLPSIVYWTKWVNHDYGVPIIGDSMDPDYHNKDIALIHEQSCPDYDGQVCAVIDFDRGGSFIKCVTVEAEFLRLVSLNRSVPELLVNFIGK